EDAGRPRRMAAPQARRRHGVAAAAAHRARRRVPLQRARGAAAVSLRTRLTLAVAYVLLLAIVALGVPLALSLRDRVDAEVRGQARSQADVVAASAAELLNPRSRKTLEHLTAISARTVRGRVAVIAKSGRVLADSAGSSTIGTNYGSRPEVASAL